MTLPMVALDGLERDRPEWRPWLAVVREVVREAESARWDAAVPARIAPQAPGVPLLAGAPLSLPVEPVRQWADRLLRFGSRAGTPAMKSLDAVSRSGTEALELFNASLCQDAQRVREVATTAGVDVEALQALAALLPVPFLLAFGRRAAASRSESWIEGYCSTCGAWPAFVEVRGIERSRYCRCGRCGGEWHATALSCPYCATRDHEALVAFVPERSGAPGTIDACTRCGGYVKTFTRLQGCLPAAVLLEDLASVDLDVAALDQGYRRPSGSGYSWEVARA
jgi:FdhE protein